MTRRPHAQAPTSSSSPRRNGILLAVALATGTTGCPSADVDGRFDEFVENTEDEREDSKDVRMDMGSALADVTGTFLFALDTVASPGLPLQFIATVTFAAEGAGGTLGMDLQPLALMQGSSTDPRTPAGEVIEVPGIAVDESGGFMVALGVLEVTGAANPITQSDIKADVSLSGGIQSVDLFCGTVDGMVSEPTDIPLRGSTFAAQRIEATDPASLPTEVLLRCPEGGGMTDDGGSTEESGGGGGSGTGG